MKTRKTCPVVRLHLTAEDTIQARGPSGRNYGFIRWNESDDGFAAVDMIESSAAPRCGLGTKLYEAAARHLCKRGLRLASGEIRSYAADGFWQKQTRKGRAECLKPHTRGIYYEDFVKPYGWYSDHPDDPDEEEPIGPPCGGYALKASMCKKGRLSLDGLGPRRRKRLRR
jgi:hypothetical protein